MFKREGHIFDFARAGNLDSVKEKIESDGFDPKATNEDGVTALHFAVGSDSLEVVKYLVEQGADPSAKNNDGWTILHYAAESGSLEMVQYLVEKGATIHH